MTELRQADRAPRRHPQPGRRLLGRTWELELIVSGAVTYGLLQLPSVVDGWFLRFQVAAAGPLDEAAQYGYVYAKIALYALIAGFLLHLTMRAYWVGLIGLQTAFPHGVRWERLNYGPITEAVHRRRQPPLRVLIRRVDRFASVILSASFQLVLFSVVSVVLAAVLGGFALGISRLLLSGAKVGTVFNVLLFSVLGMGMAVPLVDRYFGARLSPEGGVGRLIRSLTRGYYHVFGGIATFPIVNILLSNYNRRLANTVFGTIFAALFIFFFIRDIAIPRGRVSAGNLEFFPVAAGRRGVDARHYESHRTGAERAEPTPSIQSDIVTDPFVRLFVPYLPARHNAVIRDRCPEVRPLQSPGIRFRPRRPDPPPEEAMASVLSCLARLQRVTVNGAEASGLRFHFYVHPVTRSRGLVAYLATADLPAGENLIVVEETRTNREGEDPRPERHYIPFWVGG